MSISLLNVAIPRVSRNPATSQSLIGFIFSWHFGSSFRYNLKQTSSRANTINLCFNALKCIHERVRRSQALSAEQSGPSKEHFMKADSVGHHNCDRKSLSSSQQHAGSLKNLRKPFSKDFFWCCSRSLSNLIVFMSPHSICKGMPMKCNGLLPKWLLGYKMPPPRRMLSLPRVFYLSDVNRILFELSCQWAFLSQVSQK